MELGCEPAGGGGGDGGGKGEGEGENRHGFVFAVWFPSFLASRRDLERIGEIDGFRVFGFRWGLLEIFCCSE